MANAKIRRRYIVDGDKPLQLRLTRAGGLASAVNWAGSKGVLAATLCICGDGEDSLTNTDVAVETAITFLTNLAMSGVHSWVAQSLARHSDILCRT